MRSKHYRLKAFNFSAGLQFGIVFHSLLKQLHCLLFSSNNRTIPSDEKYSICHRCLLLGLLGVYNNKKRPGNKYGYGQASSDLSKGRRQKASKRAINPLGGSHIGTFR
jgi:hypothetical protein